MPSLPTITLTRPLIITAVKAQITSARPDLLNNELNVIVTLLDSNNQAVGQRNLTVPFTSLEGAWTGKVNDTVTAAILAVLV